jgi:hypothetical protein
MASKVVRSGAKHMKKCGAERINQRSKPRQKMTTTKKKKTVKLEMRWRSESRR